jgi:hypothetical protein
MAHIKKSFLCLITLLFLIPVSCATTELTAVWEAPGFNDSIRKIVVVGAFQNQAIRNIFEDEFVKMLSDSGLDVTASYTIIPVEKVDKMDYVMSQIRESGADTVLVTRLIDIKTEQIYMRESVYYMPEYYRYWGHYQHYMYSPGYIVNIEYAYAETNIYNVNDGKMIWSAHSKTQISATDEKLIISFVRTIVDRLLESGLTAY